MKSLNSKKRKEAVEEFFTRLDRIAMGFVDEEWIEEKRAEEKEASEIFELQKTIKECLHCNNKGELRLQWNLEYPEGCYIQCIRCGMRTDQYVKFIDNRYSKLESVKKAIEVWNKRIK